MVDAADKLSYFQAITGLEDPDLCTEILAAHGWDLELAISSFTAADRPNSPPPTTTTTNDNNNTDNDPSSSAVAHTVQSPHHPGLAWKIIKLPVSVISGSLGLVSGAIGIGLWVAGGVLSYSLGMIGLGGGAGNRPNSERLAPVSEAMEFVGEFEREYGLADFQWSSRSRHLWRVIRGEWLRWREEIVDMRPLDLDRRIQLRWGG